MMILINTDEMNDVLVYHCRIGPSGCRECGTLPLGSSFTEHQVAQIVKRGTVIKP